MAIMPAVSERGDAFNDDLGRLRDAYPEIDEVVQEFAEVLLRDAAPRFAVDLRQFPNTYFHLLDYPPLGSRGIQRFVATYHVRETGNPMREPFRTVTLLSISERRKSD